MALSSFRRTTKTETKKTGGKGGRGNWREQYRIPKIQPSPFMLIQGDYIDEDPDPDIIEVDVATGAVQPVKAAYYKWLKHRVKGVSQYTGKPKFTDEPCSRGWDKHNPKPCAGCAAMDAGAKHITLVEAYSIGLVHLVMYHRHPTFDREKGFIMKKDNSGYYMSETECFGKSCNFCRMLTGQPLQLQQNETWPQYDPKTISNVFGSRRYLEIGKGHLGDLGEWDRQIGSQCGGVAYMRNPDGGYMLNQQGQAIIKGRCNAYLNVDGYACSSCGNLLINAETDPRPLDQLEAVAMKKYPCHFCQRPTFLKELNSCDSCGSAVVNGLFDLVLWGVRQGEDTQSHLVLPKFESVEEFESQLHSSYRELLGGKPLRERVVELLKPYDFAELYKPKSLEDQAKRLGTKDGPAQPGAYGPPVNYSVPPPMQIQATPQYGGPVGPGVVPQTTPQYQPYPAPQGAPGPAPFIPPTKPHFGN